LSYAIMTGAMLSVSQWFLDMQWLYEDILAIEVF